VVECGRLEICCPPLGGPWVRIPPSPPVFLDIIRRPCALAILAVVAVGLSACGAIPLSTIARLSAFGESDFVALAPEVLRVRVSVPDGYVLDVGKVELAVEITVGATPETQRFHLQDVAEDHGLRDAGPIFGGIPVATTTLRLADASQKAFRDVQRSATLRKASNIHLDVNVALRSAPAHADSMRVWIDLLLSREQGYFTLIDGGAIRLNKKQN
jgi:hypothetical protein